MRNSQLHKSHQQLEKTRAQLHDFLDNMRKGPGQYRTSRELIWYLDTFFFSENVPPLRATSRHKAFLARTLFLKITTIPRRITCPSQSIQFPCCSRRDIEQTRSICSCITPTGDYMVYACNEALSDTLRATRQSSVLFKGFSEKFMTYDKVSSIGPRKQSYRFQSTTISPPL